MKLKKWVEVRYFCKDCDGYIDESALWWHLEREHTILERTFKVTERVW